MLGQCFAELTQFDQGGIGIAGEGALGSGGQLHEELIMLGEKTEIGRGVVFGYLHNDSPWPRKPEFKQQVQCRTVAVSNAPMTSVVTAYRKCRPWGAPSPVAFAQSQGCLLALLVAAQCAEGVGTAC